MSMPGNASHKQNRAIYCVVDNPELEAALKTFAEEINCEILFDWPNSIELILEHYFIAIVDGSIIDEAVWNMYVEFCNNGDIRVPCLLFGDTGRLQIPEYGNVYRIASNDYGVILDIIKNIKSGLLTSA
ncbi:MAG: hypothetical protein C4560_10135 [Nitrospiraceae bacterium]|nr:MAG: hypothetical protein C4560_10135 [Nitrospiraceae bacterium]